MFNLIPLLPEILVLVLTCSALLVELFVPKHSAQRVTYFFALFIVFCAFLCDLILYKYPATLTLHGMYVHDSLGSLLKILIELTTFFAFIYAQPYLQTSQIKGGEYYILGLFSLLGMMVLVSGHDLLVLFLGLEILSIPLYAMIALWRHNGIAAEAAMKYYVMGALATGLLLYGLSLLYGATGNLELSAIVHTIAEGSFKTNALLFSLSLVFILAGLAFKLGAAPFHSWVPDVYQGSPTAVTLFIGSAPKIAGLGLALRILLEALPSLKPQWQQLLIIVALASMALGNIAAIAQTNIKRMLAYSSIAHMGYMALGFLSGTADGYASAVFYIIIYALMSMGAFAVILIMSSQGFEAENIDDYRGLNSRNPWLAFMMLLLMFSMAGIPPTAGFFAKLGVLEALVSAHFVWLAALALIFAVVGSYYYLAIVKVMYFEEAQGPLPMRQSSAQYIAISVNSIAILLLGFFPTQVIDLCRSAFAL